MPALRVQYQTIEFGDVDLHVCSLRDRQQFLDTDGAAAAVGISSAEWPLFGVLWASGRVLAQLMSEEPVAGKRILEVGCGIALASLVLNHRSADITASDRHPEAAAFLRRNTALNEDACIPFTRAGWADADSDLGDFDLIIGSDVLYEAGHVQLLGAFIERHARARCEVVIVDPGRGHHARFSKLMVRAGYSHTQERAEGTDPLQPSSAQVLRYRR